MGQQILYKLAQTLFNKPNNSHWIFGDDGEIFLAEEWDVGTFVLDESEPIEFFHDMGFDKKAFSSEDYIGEL